MQEYRGVRRIEGPAYHEARSGKPVSIISMMLGGMLAGFTSTIKTPPMTDVGDGNDEAIASCLDRHAEGRHTPGLIESEPFWTSSLSPAVTRCAGSAPMPVS